MTSRSRVALCFFGLVKNYEHVARSVETFILNPLSKASYDQDVYIHTYNQSTTTNPRNGEENSTVTPSSILSYFPQAVVKQDSPDKADNLRPLDYYLQNGDPWHDNPRVSMRHYVRQLYSLQQVTSLWQQQASKYNLVIYLRPDVRFLSPLPLLSSLKENQIVLPSFHGFAGYNDRFAYGCPSTMKRYGERITWLETFFARYKAMLHAEPYLKLFLEAHKIEPVLISFPFVRIRADGRPNVADPRREKNIVLTFG